jgi:hypothetical protein
MKMKIKMKIRVITKVLGLFVVSAGLFSASHGDAAEMIEPVASPAADASSGGGSHGNLAAQATNPLAPLIQFQMQNYFIPDSIGASGYANQIIVQPVIPIAKKDWLPDFVPRSIFRPTIPIVTTADIDGGPQGTTGLGDVAWVYIFAMDHDWGSLGIGGAGALPTATDHRLGARKWTLGPSLFGIYTKIPKVQLGALVFNTFDVGGSGPNDVNSLAIQIIANYHWGDGWFAGWGDQAFTFDWENNGAAYVPLSLRLGKVGAIGKQPVNINGEVIYNVGDALPGKDQWGFKLTVSLLIPE